MTLLASLNKYFWDFVKFSLMTKNSGWGFGLIILLTDLSFERLLKISFLLSLYQNLTMIEGGWLACTTGGWSWRLGSCRLVTVELKRLWEVEMSLLFSWTLSAFATFWTILLASSLSTNGMPWISRFCRLPYCSSLSNCVYVMICWFPILFTVSSQIFIFRSKLRFSLLISLIFDKKSSYSLAKYATLPWIWSFLSFIVLISFSKHSQRLFNSVISCLRRPRSS